MTSQPSQDVHQTAQFLRQLYLALIQVGFPERQVLVILGQAITAIPPTPAAPTVSLSVDEIGARIGRVS